MLSSIIIGSIRNAPIPFALAVCALLVTTASTLGQDKHPLKPAKTVSPRATMATFLDNMNDAYRMFRRQPLSDAQSKELRSHIVRAVRCLDLSKVPPTVERNFSLESAVMLMEIFDRIPIDLKNIPDEKNIEKTKAVSWIVPDTEIKIVQMKNGPRKGEFLFSSETVDNIHAYYERIKHLPYKPGTVLPNAAQIYLIGPGPAIPVEWVLGLPEWMRRIVLGQAVWKWLALFLLMTVASLLWVVAFRFGSRRKETDPKAPYWRRMIFPISGMVLAYYVEWAAAYQLRLVGDTLFYVHAFLVLIVYMSAAFAVILTMNAIARLISSSPRIRSKSIDAHMVRIAFRVLTIIALVLLIIDASARLGIPLTPVLAGLGVGGVAIALAAQNSLENLIGGFNLFVDRPIRVGDLCRYAGNLGVVEEIGLRSTRLRTFNRTVISIPNSSFAKNEIENYTIRDKFWFHPRIRLRLETTPDQLRKILDDIRDLFQSHAKVDPDPARIRFAQFGEYSLDLDVFAYMNVDDYAGFLETAEELNLRIMDIISDAGAALAIPARQNIVERVDKT